jgi:aminocarboxymuconate-semialdehyde decarboxylase
MIPYFEGRIGMGVDILGSRTPAHEKHLWEHKLKHRPLDYFRKFYADTAVYGPGAMECGIAFFGVDNVVYGSNTYQRPPNPASTGASARKRLATAVRSDTL